MIFDNQPFTEIQKQYLEGFFAALQQQGISPEVLTAQSSPEAQEQETEEENVYGKPVSMLSKEEKIKLEENALDIWERMLANAATSAFPEGGDVFRYKFHGLFHVAPAQNAFMLRCRIPGGHLTSFQFSKMADMAETYGGGYSDITTRANIQIREIKPENAINILTYLYNIGLTSRGSGADNVRNITASPTSGIDPYEVYDVMPLAKSMHHFILNHRALYGIPRKFNIAFDNGGAISVVADTNDIGFLATRLKDDDGKIYFRALLSGITGHKTFAKDCGILLTPEQCVPFAVAVLKVFIENGDRTNRKKARLKYLLEKLGVPKYLEVTQKILNFNLTYMPPDDCIPRKPIVRHGHIGAFPQRQEGLNYVGAVIPVGRMKSDQMRHIADIASQYGSGEVRLTVWQNLLIPGIKDEDVETVKNKLVEIGFHYKASTIVGGLVACTGNTGCKFAATNTKGQAVQLASHLENKLSLDSPINIHLTGCPNSCAQHYCGDIGLLGTKVTRDGESVEGYNVVLGGGVDNEQRLATEIYKGVPFDELPPLLEKTLTIYLNNRKDNESLIEFTSRHTDDELKQLFSLDEN